MANLKPIVLDLKAGSYWWCACGESKNQPWCDGSHKGTDKTPVNLVLDEDKKVAVCTCGHSAKVPVCDGAHSKF